MCDFFSLSANKTFIRRHLKKTSSSPVWIRQIIYLFLRGTLNLLDIAWRLLISAVEWIAALGSSSKWRVSPRHFSNRGRAHFSKKMAFFPKQRFLLRFWICISRSPIRVCHTPGKNSRSLDFFRCVKSHRPTWVLLSNASIDEVRKHMKA